MPPKLPPALLTGFSMEQAQVAEAWWRGLPPSVLAELQLLWDERNESCAYIRTGEPGDRVRFLKLAIRVEGRFVYRSEPEPRDDFRNIDFYEYLVNHELVLDENPPHHICSAHKDARDALSAGFIPASFACPFAKTDCPMREILNRSPGRSIALSLRPAPPSSPPSR